MEQQLAVRGDLVADEQVEVAEPQCEQEPGQGRIKADPACSRPRRGARGAARRLRAADRVVELRLAGEAVRPLLPPFSSGLRRHGQDFDGRQKKLAEELGWLSLDRLLSFFRQNLV